MEKKMSNKDKENENLIGPVAPPITPQKESRIAAMAKQHQHMMNNVKDDDDETERQNEDLRP